MSLRGEIKDFLSTALAVRKSMRDDENSSARNNYYQALIKNADTRAALAQKGLDLRASVARQSLGLRSQGLELQRQNRKDVLDERRQNHEEQQQYRRDRLDQFERALKNKTPPDEYSYPGGNPSDSGARAPPQATTGAGAAGDTGDEENEDGTATSDEGDNELNSNEVTGVDTAPGTQYARDESIDGGDTPAFAQGGAVGDDYDQQATGEQMSMAQARRASPAVGDDEEAPAPKSEAPRAPAPKARRPAVSDQVRGYTSSGDTAEQAAQQGGASDAKSGFKLKDALDSWEGKQPTAQQNGQVGGQLGPDLADQHAPNSPAGQGDGQVGGAIGPDLADQHAPNTTGPGTPPAQGQAAVGDAEARSDKAPDNPVSLGLRQIMDAYGLNQQGAVPGDREANGAQAMHAAKNAATDKEVAQMNEVVDPDNELSDSAKTVARLDAGVKFWLAQGNKKNAALLAQRLLEYGKQKTQVLGHAAADAVKNGDTQKGVDLLNKAYSYIPDGGKLDAKVNKDGSVSVNVIDERSGMTLDLGTMGPQQLYQYSLGVANGSEYMNHLVQIASGNIGVRKGAGGTPGVGATPKAPTLRDRQTADTMLGSEQPAAQYNVPKNMADNVGGVAKQLLVGNQMTPHEAMDLASRATDPSQPRDMFQLNPDGSATAQYNGRPVKVPRDAFLQIAAMRGQRLADRNKADADTQAQTAMQQARADRVKKAEDAQRDRQSQRNDRYKAAKRGFASQDDAETE